MPDQVTGTSETVGGDGRAACLQAAVDECAHSLGIEQRVLLIPELAKDNRIEGAPGRRDSAAIFALSRPPSAMQGRIAG
jgi:hypothetical protein